MGLKASIESNAQSFLQDLGQKPDIRYVSGVNFLLIHDGVHGAWCWEPLISELKKRRHGGIALNLPGAKVIPSHPPGYLGFTVLIN